MDQFDQKLAASTGRIRSKLRVITSESSRMSGEVEKGFGRFAKAATSTERNLRSIGGTLGGVGAAAGDMARDLATGGTSLTSIAASIATSFGPAGAAIGLASAALIPLIGALSDAEAASRDLGPDVSALRDSLADLKSAAADADGAIVGFSSSLASLAATKANAALSDLKDKIRNLTDDTSFRALAESMDFGVDASVVQGWERLRDSIGAVGNQEQLTQSQAERLLDVLRAVAAAPMDQLQGKAADALQVIAGISREAGSLNPKLVEVADAVQLAAQNAVAMANATDTANTAAVKLANSWQQVLAASQASMLAAGRAQAAISRAQAEQQQLNSSRPQSFGGALSTSATDYPLSGTPGGSATDWNTAFPVTPISTTPAAPTGGGSAGAGGWSSADRAQSRLDTQQVISQQTQIQRAVDEVNAAQQRVIDRNRELSDAFADVFVSAIDGSRSLQESLADLAKQLAEIMLSKAFQQILNAGMGTTGTASYSTAATSSSGGTDWGAVAAQIGTQLLTSFFLAKGGPAKANRPVIVGEAGPEIFVPRQSGAVIPNSRIVFTRADGGATAAPVGHVYTYTRAPASPLPAPLAPYTAPGAPQVVDSGEAPTGLYRRLAGVLEGLRAMRQGVDSPDVTVTATADLREVLKALGKLRTPSRHGQPIRLPSHPELVRPAILHDGGLAGRDGYSGARSLPAAVFHHAPRFHSGGYVKPGEVPAILQAGEFVIPKSAVSRSSKSGGTVVNLYYNPVVDNRGADVAAVARLEQAQKTMAINFRDFVQASVKDPRRR